VRPSKPEYESEPDGLDLDAMFQRLTYRVSVGTPGRGATAAIQRARHRRVVRAGLGAALAVAGVIGAIAVGGNLFLRSGPGSGDAGPTVPTPSASPSLPSTLQSPGAGATAAPIPPEALITAADVPFRPSSGAVTRLPIPLANTRAELCGIRAIPPITGGEAAVVYSVGPDGEIEQYVREVGDRINADGWAYGVRSDLDYCFEAQGNQVPGFQVRTRPLGTVSTGGYTVTLRVATTRATNVVPESHFYAVGQAGTLVTALRYDAAGTDWRQTEAGFRQLVTTAMERLVAAG